jgi:hypothetical protein
MDTPNSMVGTLLLVGLLLTLGYASSCAIYPYKACRVCSGQGQFQSRFLRAIRDCRRCGGSGRQLRAGRRAYNAWVRHRGHLRSDRRQRDPDNRDER